MAEDALSKQESLGLQTVEERNMEIGQLSGVETGQQIVL